MGYLLGGGLRCCGGIAGDARIRQEEQKARLDKQEMDAGLQEIERRRNGLRRGICFCFDADGMIRYNEERRNGAQSIQCSYILGPIVEWKKYTQPRSKARRGCLHPRFRRRYCHWVLSVSCLSLRQELLLLTSSLTYQRLLVTLAGLSCERAERPTRPLPPLK